MKYYATLNENKICISVSSLAGSIQIDEKTIELETYSEDYMYRKYENGTWSEEKFEPESTAPISEFEELKVKNTALQNDLLNTKLAMAELVEQQQADKLNNQLALAELIESIMEGGTVS